ncbi:MAG: hypothetical protein M3P33_02455, partial [bacterium]|nr:hypothetical protein [bacterium]
IALIGTITAVSFPQIRKYNSSVELRNTSQKVRDNIRNLHNRALSGELSSENLTTKVRSYWAIRIDNTADNYYEIAPCTTFDFSTCTTSADYQKIKLPNKFHITHLVSGSAKITLYFSPIDGKMIAYNSIPALINTLPISIKITSDDTTNKYFKMNINAQGNISTELL